MRIKEVCERTGLTDRAIRVYMESGLISPKQEYNYMGRRSISFCEEDIRVLEDVATLRQAGFSIADIARLQSSPEHIPELVICHCQRLTEEMETRQRILDTLLGYDIDRHGDYHTLANEIRHSASSKNIPKEDFGMNLKDVKNMIRRRIPALISLLLLVFSLCQIGSLVARVAFADVHLSSGGGYTLLYHWSPSAWGEHAWILLTVAALLCGVIALVISLAGGRRYWMLISAGFCAVTVLLLLAMPAADAGRIHLFEFVAYRKLFGNTFLYSTNNPPSLLIKSIKYIPIVLGAILSCVGYTVDTMWVEEKTKK
ncbi:MAG: MerR family transcriptional regulator [Clostridia bacterium]|nr:MerR family transcriptional regulator [Clostridia bacterium]